MSTKMMVALLIYYFVLIFFCLAEKNYSRAMYWLGATILQGSVIWMGLQIR